MAEFVLLHGTTQGPSGWARVIDPLEKAGHTTHAVELDSSADMTPDAYADRIAATTILRHRPIVVAHSGAGLILPAVARTLKSTLQVWVAAMIPDGRRSLLDEMNDTTSEMFHPDWVGVDPTDDPDAAIRFLFHDCDDTTRKWALGTLRRFVPAYAYSHPVPLTPQIPSIYVAAELDRTLQPRWCADAARRRLGVEPITLPTGHCPHTSQPNALADILIENAN